ncbi:hypothetical protein HDG40_002962 [Paraburkholderia sp. JPY158]|uniref:Uncharacterized protein n=1 Tax=Paraburkholderia atlantica TaxID=2654982 RepID=A0A7W8Q6Q5_PARAM|nr:hypothetical protein [Paraburkholderia atlantica]
MIQFGEVSQCAFAATVSLEIWRAKQMDQREDWRDAHGNARHWIAMSRSSVTSRKR